jgi:tryptophan synthase alpha chain
MNRIAKKFIELKLKEKKAFIAYLTVGYPKIAVTEKLILELSRLGADMFELGVPFSDPLADGPVIQESSAFALKHKVNLEKVFSLAARLRKKINNPILIMGYYNPILIYGLERFAKKAKLSGLDGIIVPDLSLEEESELRKYLNKYGIYLINFLAPTTDLSRIKHIARQSKGFIYYVSVTGVTGARKKLASGIFQRIGYLKKFVRIPVCVGFGISTRKQFKEISQFSDGAIFGSAIIIMFTENLGKKDLATRVVKFTKGIIPA